MYFVDDVNFETALARHVAQAFLKLAHIIDPGVTRGIDFKDVETVARFDLPTVVAVTARGYGRPFFTVQGFGENARRAGFTDPAGAGKKVGMVHPVAGNCIVQRRRNMILAGDLFEGLRPVFTG